MNSTVAAILAVIILLLVFWFFKVLKQRRDIEARRERARQDEFLRQSALRRQRVSDAQQEEKARQEQAQKEPQVAVARPATSVEPAPILSSLKADKPKADKTKATKNGGTNRTNSASPKKGSSVRSKPKTVGQPTKKPVKKSSKAKVTVGDTAVYAPGASRSKKS